MANSPLNLLDIKLALEGQGLDLSIKDGIYGNFGDILHFIDVDGVPTSGKIEKYFTEGEVNHWPLLSHENLAPLIDIVSIHDNMRIFLTIDRRVALKDIIHEEDFIQDTKCFERKKGYARGIFSGLSYLHEKSLCLMNLSDKNVVISPVDQAIISDFSCLCSRKATKSALSVPELYTAPESEKNYDATAAEIWASGILMLDMFLSHMVPWAIIDHDPKKVVTLVDELSFDLLKAANFGSVISALDFSKYKTFLGIFFRENPMTRVTARNASIASFLTPKYEKRNLKADKNSQLATNQSNQKIGENVGLNKKGSSLDLNSKTTKLTSSVITSPSSVQTKTLNKNTDSYQDRGIFPAFLNEMQSEKKQSQTASKRWISPIGGNRNDQEGSQIMNVAVQTNNSVQVIARKINSLSQYLRALSNLPVLNISADFEAKQRKILQKLRLLLLQEKMRLTVNLSRNCGDNTVWNINGPQFRSPMKPVRQHAIGNRGRSCDRKLRIEKENGDMNEPQSCMKGREAAPKSECLLKGGANSNENRSEYSKRKNNHGMSVESCRNELTENHSKPDSRKSVFALCSVRETQL